MPAQEDTYRNQHALHIVFAISSIAMFVSILWMIKQDHFREWKNVQRDFIKLDAARTERDMEAAHQLASEQELRDLESKLAEAKRAVAPDIHEAEETMRSLLGKVQKKDQELAFQKAKRDSVQSFYDIALDRGRDAEAAQIKKDLDRRDTDLKNLRQESEELNDQMDKAKKLIEKVNQDKQVTQIEKEIANKKKEKDRLKQKQWNFAAIFRSSPVVDAFSPATKIEQMVLGDLTIHYSFKGVPRFDRCTTCHKAIDSVTKEGAAAFDDETLQLSKSPYKQAFKTHSHPELYASPNSPHPRERFGCTVCHMGQGSGTSFGFASHTPNTLEQRKDWEENRDKDFGWEEIHHWPYPMHRARFVESGCVKCHTHVVDLDSPKYGETAPKLLRGYNIVRQYGCFGCHEINGFKNGQMIGPDLRLEPQTEDERIKAAKDLANPPGRMRKVGPSLRRIVEKVPPDWAARWIMLPKGFRVATRMPQFYGLTNNNGHVEGSDAGDPIKAAVEIHAVTHYLFTESAKFLSDGEEVKNLETSEFQKLVNRRKELENLQEELKKTSGKLTDGQKGELEKLKYRIPLRELHELMDPTALATPVTIDPIDEKQTEQGKQRFIERGCLACHTHQEVKADYPEAKADFGPDLSNVSIKLRDKDGKPNAKWLFNWLKDPSVHHATSFMPNLQLADPEAADIAAWLLSVDGKWENDPGQPTLDEKVLDDMLRMFLQKSMTLKQVDEALARGVPDDRVKEMRGDEKILFAPISKEKKLTYLGKKTISRMGCFGCHDIPGFETAKPIGTELSSWGIKARMDPDKLDFAHITEYIDHHAAEPEKHDPDFKLFSEGLGHHKGESFLWQKLRDPRSYDFNKLKAWDDKLRMPRFPFADNPNEVEAVMTFILGLVGDDQIPQHYRNTPQGGPKLAWIEGARALTKFNCRGCHITRMPEFTFDLGKVGLPDLAAQHGSDFPDTAKDQAAMPQTLQPKGGKLATISAMYIATDEASDEMAFDVWSPAVIDNKQFFIGDRVVIPTDAIVKDKGRDADGGQFAHLLVSRLMKTLGKSLPTEVWGFVPPPLVREGMKAQPAWLHQFLLNPTEIRPAVRLRMPRFNMSSGEAASLAVYFAAVDGTEYPYEHIRDRDETYLALKEAEHANYLRDGWRLLTMVPDVKAGVTDKLCASCHNVGNRLAGGEPEGRGPNLYLAPDRLRPEWLRQWITTPKRILPYTAMPNNFGLTPLYQDQSPGSSLEQIIAVRDALMNYQKVQASELTTQTQTQAQAQPSTGGK